MCNLSVWQHKTIKTGCLLKLLLKITHGSGGMSVGSLELSLIGNSVDLGTGEDQGDRGRQDKWDGNYALTVQRMPTVEPQRHVCRVSSMNNRQSHGFSQYHPLIVHNRFQSVIMGESAPATTDQVTM